MSITKVNLNYDNTMKKLLVRFSEDDPREGKTLNEWYKYISLYADSQLKVTRNSEEELSN